MSADADVPADIPGGAVDQAALRLARAFDRFTIGLLGIFLALYANPFLTVMSAPYARYLYLLPVWFTALVPVHLAPADLPAPEWAKTLRRLRWSALALAGLAPFWGWWQSALNSRYCLLNVGFLCLALFIYLYHLMGLARIIAEARAQGWLAHFARVTRMAIVYLLIAPVLAFFLVAWYENNSGHDILVFVDKLNPWKRHVLTAPILLAIMVCWQLCRLRPLSGQPRKDAPP